LVDSRGSRFRREVAIVADSVAVVAIDDLNNVLLISQYRHPVGARMWEIPAGRLDVEGESPEQAALRELAEEVDLKATSAQKLGVFGNSIGWTTEMTTVYLVRQFIKTDRFARRHEEASLETRWVPLSDAINEITSGVIRDAKTIVGLLLADRFVN
jgi:ADP-ribose pyrophosphatase